MNCFVYILYSKSVDLFYVGATHDVNKRLQRHNTGLENFTKKYMPWELVWFTKKPNKAEAFKLEKKLKNLSKSRKREFIKKYSNDDEA
ncbi:GIY-YIG nuclease family protein [Psychroflexus sp. CAK1W]|uniref:GIY-YIG nuclease family protein n=1 Tax=Psychroflexus curvus TaxID=2873595 RepID=UPI001CCE7FC9|nr:GIY-YIG nuclease family protein [Psychroflexus curvus]MBZ9627845.1 GIY-YIG nuclease family protein [Psychroflexus curvus]